MSRKLRVGLVLTGGGARAAYQVGVVRALADLPVELVAISSVGAGALNGAILASKEHLGDAAKELSALWSETVLSEESALRLGPVPVLRLGTYLSFLFGSGVQPEIRENLTRASSKAYSAYKVRNAIRSPSSGDVLIDALATLSNAITVTTDLELDHYLSSSFRNAASNPVRPFFVSVYETRQGLLHSFKQGLQLAGVLRESAPRFFEVSAPDLAAEDRISAVLASASLPFLCQPQLIGGKQYIDGSFAGMRASPGAVPLQPFRRRSALAIDAILVVHTEDGVSWNATQFPGMRILEVRPSLPSAAFDVSYFWPDKKKLLDWMDLGRLDTSGVVGALLRTWEGWKSAEEVHKRVIEDSLDL